MNDSIISVELRKRLHDCVRTAEQEYTCSITLDPEFTGFQGCKEVGNHFQYIKQEDFLKKA